MAKPSKWVCGLWVASVVLSFVPSFSFAGKPVTQVVVSDTVLTPIYSHTEALGDLRANESVLVSVSVSETISSIRFDDGEQVEEGEILVELHHEEESALLIEAETAVIESKRQLDRVRELVKVGNASQATFDERQRNYDASQARLAATQSRFNDRIIRAPFAGKVGLRSVSLGALVRPGDSITTLTDSSEMKLDFSVPAVLLAQLKTGLPIVAKSAAYPGRVFKGEVSSIDNQIDPVTRSIRVRAKLPNQEQLLKQGMAMTVDLFYNQRESIVIPEEAIIKEAKSNFAYIVESGEEGYLVVKRRLKLGERYNGTVEILEGLSIDEQVITHGSFKVSPGDNVKIVTSFNGV